MRIGAWKYYEKLRLLRLFAKDKKKKKRYRIVADEKKTTGRIESDDLICFKAKFFFTALFNALDSSGKS